MLEDVRKEAEERMNKSLTALDSAFARIRTGRAHPGLLDSVQVDYYGTPTPLNQVANITVEDNRTLAISPWEKPMVPAIEKAILKSDLGLNPSTSGDKIRLPMPPLTEENRRDLTKVAKGEAETARIAVRNARRDANAYLKELLKEKEITEDEERRGEELIQKLTDQKVKEIDQALEAKEKDLMEI
ncbi:MAG: ribosome recycling factor [Pseudomonadales bacterium]|nr:ribosome recycling factor [Pseudomonadales bacterium]